MNELPGAEKDQLGHPKGAFTIAGRPGCSRREFLTRVAAGTAGLTTLVSGSLGSAAEAPAIPVVIFSKAYQPLKFTFEESAEFTAEAGLAGVDSPVRPDGEVLPERVADELPKYCAALRRRNLRMPYITTAITGPGSPHAERTLRTARKLGVERYRLGFIYRSDSWVQQLQEVRAQLKDLASLNKEIGIGAVLQNHSPSGRTYVGGDLRELAAIVEGFDPEQIGVAFDIAHALNVHGQDWRGGFEQIRPHLKVVYLKDTNVQKHFVPLGEGLVGESGYFKLLKTTAYRAPVCLHVEYDGGRQPATRAALLEAVKKSLAVISQWMG